MNKSIKPLYRKVNTKARGVHHNFGGDHKYERHLSKNKSTQMKKNVSRGLDYTPLYKFLLKNVGKNWSIIQSEAISRLLKSDKEKPIERMVYKSLENAPDTIRTGDNSYYSALYVDKNDILQIVNKSLNETSFIPSCSCCTHTFNGIAYTQKYNLEKILQKNN
jgi:hypothetical protein